MQSHSVAALFKPYASDSHTFWFEGIFWYKKTAAGTGVDGCQENAYLPVSEQLATWGGGRRGVQIDIFSGVNISKQHTELNTR